MPFAVGYAYERISDKRQVVVSKIQDEGRAALLRFDDGHEEWFLWPDFLNSAKWLPIGTKEAAN